MASTKERDLKVEEEQSEPYSIKLSDGSYLLWDRHNGHYRVSYFARNNATGMDLEYTIALAMKKPPHNSKVHDIFEFISKSEAYAAVSS